MIKFLSTVDLKIYAYVLYLVMFCFHFEMGYFAHVLQWYFTNPGAIIWLQKMSTEAGKYGIFSRFMA